MTVQTPIIAAAIQARLNFLKPMTERLVSTLLKDPLNQRRSTRAQPAQAFGEEAPVELLRPGQRRQLPGEDQPGAGEAVDRGQTLDANRLEEALKHAAEVAILLPPGYNLGHVHMGRGNLWGLDLNRDYMKLEPRDLRAYRSLEKHFTAEERLHPVHDAFRAGDRAVDVVAKLVLHEQLDRAPARQLAERRPRRDLRPEVPAHERSAMEHRHGHVPGRRDEHCQGAAGINVRCVRRRHGRARRAL